MAGIFARGYRSAHEPECEELVRLVLDLATSVTSSKVIQDYLLLRDQRLGLELESDGTLWHFLPRLVELFPRSRFILTMRDCYSWLDSIFNHDAIVDSSGPWRRYEDLTYAQWDFHYEPEEETLKAHDLRTLGHYLSHWAAHNQTVLDLTPPERRLIVRTDRIRQSLPTIAAFLGVPLDTLDATQAHLHRSSRSLGLLSKIDPGFVRQRVDELCGPMMKEYFPDVAGPPARA